MAIKDTFAEMQSFDWSNLSDLETIGIWPAPVKALIVVSVFAACCAAGFFLHIQNLRVELQAVVTEEDQLRIEFEQKAFLAANLEEYRAQTVQMEESFAELLRQLPGKTEVAGLVDDVTNTGLGSGLEISNFALAPEVVQEFYIELPIEIDVLGDYHDFGTFVSGVASLDRIVTLHDFEINTRTDSFLSMSILAKTYRYKSDEDE